MAASACLLLALIGVVAGSNFAILSAPNSVKINNLAGSIRAKDVSNVVSNAMGFESPSTTVSWSGLVGGNLFSRPSACLSIFFDGYAEALPVNTLASFSMASASSLVDVLAPSAGSIASVVSEAAPTQSFTLSMSASESFAVAGSSRDVTSNQDLAIFESQGSFVTPSGALVSSDEVNGLFSENVLGSDVTFSGNTFSVKNGQELVAFDVSEPSIRALFSELHSMLFALKKFSSAKSGPAVYTFTVSSISTASLTSTQRAALGVVLARFVEKMTEIANASFNNNVFAVAIFSPKSRLVSRGISFAQQVSSTSSVGASNSSSSPSWNSPFPTANPRSRDYVDFCQDYIYFCNKASNGQSYPIDGDNTCINATNCPYFPCPKSSPYIQRGAARCIKCIPGFIIQSGHCYVSSNYPGMFQIWFFGGLAIAIALIATCYTIGYMDPGRDGIIYRMTTQRLKAN